MSRSSSKRAGRRWLWVLLAFLPLLVVVAKGCRISFSDNQKPTKHLPDRYNDERPGPAPWSREPLPRSAADEVHLQAWGRSKVRDQCPLLLPISTPPGTPGAAGDEREAWGWVVWFGEAPPRIVISALGKQARSDFARPGSVSTYAWREGDLVSAVTYFPNYPDPARGTEAIIIIDGMECGYELFDPFGIDHLDQLISDLRFVERDPRKGR